jgi:PGF-CTERM protein
MVRSHCPIVVVFFVSFTDDSIKEDRDYYYKVVATSDSGDGEMSRLSKAMVREEEGPGFGAVLALAAVILSAAWAASQRGRRS